MRTAGQVEGTSEEKGVESGRGRPKRVRQGRELYLVSFPNAPLKGEAGRTHGHTQKRFVCQNNHHLPGPANTGRHATPSPTRCPQESLGLSPAGLAGTPGAAPKT